MCKSFDRKKKKKKERIVYKCIACTIQQLKKVYLGLTEGEFKTYYYKHSKSFRTKSYSNSTTLSSYVWEVKTEQNKTPNLNWEIVRSKPACFYLPPTQTKKSF